MLKRLYINNIRCLTNFELKPQQISVLVGPNGGGKSTVLEVLSAVTRLVQTGANVDECFPLGTTTRWENRTDQQIELDLIGSDGLSYEYALVIRHDPDQRTVVIHDEKLSSDGAILYRLQQGEVQLFGDGPSTAPQATFPVGSKRSFLSTLEPRHDNQRVHVFKDWVNRIWLFALQPSQMEPVSLKEMPGLTTNGMNFVSWFRVLLQEQPQVAEYLRNDMQPIMPGLTGMRLVRLGLDSKMLRLDFSVEGVSYHLGLDELSAGQRTLFVLYTILRTLAGSASLLVVDEPDNFVASAEIQPWLAQVREVVLRDNNRSLMAISHHPEVVDYLAADQAIFLWRNDGSHTKVRDVQVDLQRGLSASEWLRLEGAHVE